MASETIANGTTEIFHKLDLNIYGLEDIPENQKQNAKQEVADFLKNEILRDVNNGVSPVQGEGRFKRLDKEYAVRDKSGNRLSNLELEGDLLNDFDVVPSTGAFLDIGHKSDQTPKADGHNQLSGKAISWARSIGFPRRRYIPDDNQRFTGKITGEIRKILSEFVPETPQVESVEVDTISDVGETPTQVSVSTASLFSDDVIDSLLEDAVRRRDGF